MDSPHALPRIAAPSGLTPRGARSSHGFSLTELLVVVGIIALLAGLLGPAFQAIKGGKDMTSMAIDIKGVLDQARSQAMAQNTYVYVGIQEVDAINPAARDGIGKVVMATLASQDGTRPRSLNANVSPIGKARTFDNLHLTNSTFLTSGDMKNRPGGSASKIPDSSVTDLMSARSALSFSWPLGTGGKYSFGNVIEFDPRGIARVQTEATPTSEIQPFIEIALVPTKGNQVKESLTQNQAAIQIDGVTGRVTLYRP